MSGKFALIIGNTEYTDPGLAQLTAPGKDAEDLALVLKDQDIGAFDVVNVLMNQLSSTISEAIDEFFDQKKPDDLLVLYFSGHGVRDELGALYLAVRNTNRARLRSTAVKSDYIRDAMDQSRSKRQVLILDCCNSGAFSQGTKAATGVSIGTASAFEAGYGRIILTASDATQFAWEGDKVIGETKNSLFTYYLVKGLRGQADLDKDGRITVDELYDFAYEQVRLATPKQTPSKFATKQQGEIVLCHTTTATVVKSLIQQNINLRQNASLRRADSTAPGPHLVERALAKIKDLQHLAKVKLSVRSSIEKDRQPAKQVLVFIFWLFVVLIALPFITSLVNLYIQNIVLLFWVLVILFGAIGASRGLTKESIVFLGVILVLALNHLFRRYMPIIYDLPDSSISLFWIRVITLEIFIYLSYQFGRLISRRTSKAAADNRFQEIGLSAILGAFNGYLIAGTALFYYFLADYPFQNFIAQASDPTLTQTINKMMLYMPPQLLGEPLIYFAVILAFMFVLIVLA